MLDERLADIPIGLASLKRSESIGLNAFYECGRGTKSACFVRHNVVIGRFAHPGLHQFLPDRQDDRAG